MVFVSTAVFALTMTALVGYAYLETVNRSTLDPNQESK